MVKVDRLAGAETPWQYYVSSCDQGKKGKLALPQPWEETMGRQFLVSSLTLDFPLSKLYKTNS